MIHEGVFQGIRAAHIRLFVEIARLHGVRDPLDAELVAETVMREVRGLHMDGATAEIVVSRLRDMSQPPPATPEEPAIYDERHPRKEQGMTKYRVTFVTSSADSWTEEEIEADYYQNAGQHDQWVDFLVTSSSSVNDAIITRLPADRVKRIDLVR